MILIKGASTKPPPTGRGQVSTRIRAPAAPMLLLVGLLGMTFLAGCARATDPVYSCTDTMPGSEEPMCSHHEARLKLVNGCQNPCDKNAGCTVPTSYDCTDCEQCSVTATTPIWKTLACEVWEHGGGLCDPIAGCPECKQRFTTCSNGGTFLPSSERMHTATGQPPQCKTCPAGRYADDAVLAHVTLDGEVLPPHNFECLKCASGQFQDEEGKASCKECYPGSITNTLALTGASVCTACFKGQVSSVSTSRCIACDPGKSTMNKDNQTSCMTCEAGKSSGLDAETCTDCKAGEFQKFPARASCDVCPGGWISRLDGLEECEKCKEGKKLTSPTPNDASAHNKESACETCNADLGMSSSADQSAECSTCEKDGQFFTNMDTWTPWPEKPRFSACMTGKMANNSVLLSSNPSLWAAPPGGGRKPLVEAGQRIRIGKRE